MIPQPIYRGNFPPARKSEGSATTVHHMRRYRLGSLIGLSVTLALAGCSSTGSRTHLNPAIPAPRIPATSPLSACVDPSPAKAKPADAAIAKHFTDGRITSTLSLDGGQFRATPPADSAKPEIDAALAYCNLLAGIDSSNRGVIESIPAHGVSFGLGVLTVDKSLAQIDQGFHAVGPGGTPLPTPQANLTPYAKRLAGFLFAGAATRDALGRTTSCAGVERWLGHLALRAGVARDLQNQTQTSGGIGLRLGRFGLDAAVATHSRNLTHERATELGAGFALYH